jgi:hypothetical protein
MAMSFNPYQQRMPSFRRPPPRRSRFNPFMNRGIGGFRGLGGRGQRRRPPPRGRFPQSFGGFGNQRRFAQQSGGMPTFPPRRGRGSMFGGFPQQQRGRQSPFSNLFGGIGGFGGSRGFNPYDPMQRLDRRVNPFMNRFGGGGFNPFARFGGVDPRVGKPTPQEAPALEPQVMGGPDAPAAPPPMETTAPVMPAAPQPVAPAIPEMPPAPIAARTADFQDYNGNMVDDRDESFTQSLHGQGPLPTVGPPGTTITPAAPQANQYISPQEQFLTDHPDLDWTPLTPSPAPPFGGVGDFVGGPAADIDYSGWPKVGSPGANMVPVPALPEAPQGIPPTANQYGFTPGTGMQSQVMTPWVNKETGETYNAPNPGYQPPPGSAWERAGFARLDLTQPPPASSPQPLPMQPLPIGQQPLLPPMPGKEPRTPPFIGRGPAAPLSPIPPVNVVQENIEREIIPPQLPVAPMQQATPNTLGVPERGNIERELMWREPGFTQADIMRPQMTGTPATAFPSLLPHQQPHQQFAPTNLMGEPQKKALRDLLSRGRFGPGGF